MSLLSNTMELCIYNQRGFCKFGAKCLQKHENKVCENRSECTNNDCTERHPRLCRYFCQNGHCNFGEDCAYSHVMDNKVLKMENIEKEVKELKESKEKLEKLENEVNDLKEDKERMKIELSNRFEKEVGEMKEEMRMMKLLLMKMHKTIKAGSEVEGKTSKEDENDKKSKENKKNPFKETYKY